MNVDMIIEGAQVKEHVPINWNGGMVKNSSSYKIERQFFELSNRNQPMTRHEKNNIVTYTAETN